MATLTKDNANILPTADSLTEAAKLEVFDEKGTRISFGALILKQRTVVVFISGQTFVGIDECVDLINRQDTSSAVYGTAFTYIGPCC